MMLLSEVALAVNGRLSGADVMIACVDSDSRNIEKNQLFVAIKGERFDGNTFALEAINKSAAAVLISDASSSAQPAVIVDDTRLALGQLAAYWRSKSAAPVVAITGSNGKTTTKEMLSAILVAATGNQSFVHATKGNLNNDIGLPLTLLKTRAQHQYVVAELDYLTHIAKPNVAVINNAGTAHIGELGSRENIAQAKGEIFAGLASYGIAVINEDSAFASYWKSLNANRKVLTFSTQQRADVSANFEQFPLYTVLDLTTSNGTVSFDLPVAGLHNVQNALAASTAAVALGISNENIAKGLSGFAGVYGRLQYKRGFNAATLIDDTYNANPDSMKVALDVLSALGNKHVFVMGDMGELGVDASAMHAEVGRYAKQKGIQHFFTLGEASCAAAAAYGEGAKSYDDLDALVEAVKPLLASDVYILVKGSRFMRMERVVAKLLELDEKNQKMEKTQCC
ncbi:MAG: UDP-N-acetylmuramoyl-tripeptide--D-alanyl-D-alanine ligase [Methylophilus sp.]|jgi:UDP-N-acetylmuramoyl-tripeptide--D-alanyl-D-alanine ligase